MKWHVFLFSELNGKKAQDILWENGKSNLSSLMVGTMKVDPFSQKERLLLTLCFLDAYSSDLVLELKELFRTIEYEHVVL